MILDMVEVVERRNRNRVEFQAIYPATAKNAIALSDQNTMLGISIGSPATSGMKARAIFNFLHSKGLNKINLFIGDGLYFYSAMIKYDCDFRAAKQRGLQQGLSLLDE